MKIVVFAYRRWQSVAKLLSSLDEQNFKDITIYVDGSRSNRDAADVDKVAAIAESYSNVECIKRSFNWGMYYNIVDGLSRIEAEEFIVLEEDLSVTHLSLLIDQLTDLWDKNLFSISLMSYLKASPTKDVEYFELDRFFCWGWFTKKEKLVELNFNRISLALETSKLSVLRHGDLSSMYYNALTRRNNSWAAVVSANVINKGWKNIMFRGGVVQNVGYDGENMNVAHKNIFRQYLIDRIPSNMTLIKLSIFEYWRIHWRFRKPLKAIVYIYEIFTGTRK